MKPVLSGGAVITSKGIGFVHTRESVKNPESRPAQINRMRTEPVAKISKAPPKTLEQWHVEITNNPHALDSTVRELDHALAKLGMGGQPKSSEHGGFRDRLQQSVTQAAHSSVGHAVTWTANAIASVPDGGNVKRNMNTVLAQSKWNKIDETAPASTRGAAALRNMLGAISSNAPNAALPAANQQRLQSACEATMHAHRVAVAAAQKHDAAVRLLTHATALRADLVTAHTNSARAAERLAALTGGRRVADFQTDVNEAKRALTVARNTFLPVQEQLDKAKLALDSHHRVRKHQRQELDTIRAYPRKLDEARQALARLNTGFMQQDGIEVQVDRDNPSQLRELAQQIDERQQQIDKYAHLVQASAEREAELHRAVGPDTEAAFFIETTFLEAEYASALDAFAAPRRELDNAKATLHAAQERYDAILDMQTIQKAGQEVTQRGIKQLTKTVTNAQLAVAAADSERRSTELKLQAAEVNEMVLAIRLLPGFESAGANADDASAVRKQLERIAMQLDARPLDLSKPRMPSSSVLNIVLGGLNEAAPSKGAGETDAAAASRRMAEAREVLDAFASNLPPSSSPAHQRWHAAIKSLPGGLSAMDQLGRRNFDEEKPVVLAIHIAARAREALAQPDLPSDDRVEHQALEAIAAHVAERGNTAGLNDQDRLRYETAVDATILAPASASDVATIVSAHSQSERLSEAEREQYAAAASVAARIQQDSPIDDIAPEQRQHYEEVLRRVLVTRRTATHVGERAQGLLDHDVPGVDRRSLIAAGRAASQIVRDGHLEGVSASDLKAYNALLKEQNAVRRTASRVEAIARNTLDRNVPGADADMMTKAAAAAASIGSKGHDYGLSEADRAHFYAVRNGFTSPRDPTLLAAQAGFDKLNNEWLERAHLAANNARLDAIPAAKLKKKNPDNSDPRAGAQLTRDAAAATKAARAREMEAQGLRTPARGRMPVPRNTMMNKTPFTPTALREAAAISTLGYADPARPMQRLDKVVSRVMTHLSDCVRTIPSESLNLEQAVSLAAVLATRDKATANPKTRPGHVALDKTDVGRIADIMGTPEFAALINPMHTSLETINHEIANFIGDDGKRMGDALALSEVVNKVLGRIPTKLADGSDNIARKDLVKDMGIADDMTSTDTVAEIHTALDLYKHLKPKIQQLELRGKEKSAAGGSFAGSTKLITFPIEIVTELTGLPRGALVGGKARSAVFEIGYSTTGFEIFIGSEDRKGGAGIGSFGFRGGVKDMLVGAGAGIDKTLSADVSKTPGVWLKFPRGDGDEVVRDRALAALQTLLGVKEENGVVTLVEEPSGQLPGTAIPAKAAKLLANHPNMSMSVIGDYKETNFRNELSGAATLARIKMGFGDNVPGITAAQIGAATTRRNKEFKYSDATGYMRLTRWNKFSGGIAYAQYQVGGLADSFSHGNSDNSQATGESAQGQQGIGSNGSNGFAQGQAGELAQGSASANPSHTQAAFGSALAQSRQVKEKGIDTKYRGISRDGEINAVDTRIDKENLSLKDHLSRISADRRAWIECGINELFKDPNDPTPMREKVRIAEAWLDDHMEAVKGIAGDNGRHVFSLSYSLKPVAGAALNGLMAQAEQHKRLASATAAQGGAPSAINHGQYHNRILERADAVLLDPGSWREWKITASERTSEKLRKGWMLGAEFTGNVTEEGQRGFNSYPK